MPLLRSSSSEETHLGPQRVIRLPGASLRRATSSQARPSSYPEVEQSEDHTSPKETPLITNGLPYRLHSNRLKQLFILSVNWMVQKQLV